MKAWTASLLLQQSQLAYSALLSDPDDKADCSDKWLAALQKMSSKVLFI